jgi:hypothetical protein
MGLLQALGAVTISDDKAPEYKNETPAGTRA